MNLPIIAFHGREEIQAVSARALHAALGGDPSNFARWVAYNITGNQMAIRGEDWVSVTVTETPQVGRPGADYEVTIDFAKRLAMMARTEEGEAVRRYFIECERRAQAPAIPRAAADWLAMAPEDQAIAYFSQAKELKAVTAARAAEAPLVAYAKQIEAAVNSVTIGSVAKTAGLPPKAFTDWVHAKCCFKRGGEWWHREDYGPNGLGWLEMKTGTWEAKSGAPVSYHTVMVTGKGQKSLVNAWQKAQAVVTADSRESADMKKPE